MDCVPGTQFESSRAHHAVRCEPMFPGLSGIARNLRAFPQELDGQELAVPAGIVPDLCCQQVRGRAAWLRTPALAEILVVEGLDISITGFSPVEIDQLSVDFEENASDPDDASTRFRPPGDP